MVLQISICCWGIFSVFAIAFQCGLPMPWLYLPDRCIGSGALWYAVLIWSTITDAWLAVSAWPSFPDMQLSSKQRQTAAALMGSRFLVCVLGVAQVALLGPALTNVNQPRAMPNPTVFKHLVMNGSLITAALPMLFKPLAMHIPALSAHATIYRSDVENGGATTPLEEIKRPADAALPNPKKFDGMVTETEVKSPSEEKETYLPQQQSISFDKEIGVGR